MYIFFSQTEFLIVIVLFVILFHFKLRARIQAQTSQSKISWIWRLISPRELPIPSRHLAVFLSQPAESISIILIFLPHFLPNFYRRFPKAPLQRALKDLLVVRDSSSRSLCSLDWNLAIFSLETSKISLLRSFRGRKKRSGLEKGTEI